MLSTRQSIYEQDARSIESTRNGTPLGTIAETADGRSYKFGQAGASNLAAGLITQPPADVANDITQTGVATTVGDTSVAYTTTGAISADAYADGYFIVAETGPNLYHVVGNTAATAGNSYLFTVKIDSPITVATTTASKFSLLPNPLKATVVSAYAGQPAFPINGVPNVAVTATYYYWSQVGGYAAVLSDGAITKNAEAIPSNGVAGAVEIRVDATVVKAVGYAPELTIDTKYWPIVLTLL